MSGQKQDVLTDIDSERRSGSSWWNHVPAMTVAAAVGAGVALLVATERGRQTTRTVSRKVRDLDLPSRASSLGSAAVEGYEMVRHRRRRKSHGALYATLGTMAGAVFAAAMAPESTRKARNWASNTIDDFRHNASARWSEHRAARRNRVTPSTADALRRLEDVSMENGYPEEAGKGQEGR